MRLRFSQAFGVAVFVLACSVAGYLIGPEEAVTQLEVEQARQRAFGAALTASARDAATLARRRGSRKGVSAGRLAGRSEGRTEGTAAGTQMADKLMAQRQAERTDSGLATAQDLPLSTAGPAPQGTNCPPPFSYHMGICKIARPARPDECPKGWTPAGVTGACAPPKGVDPRDPVEWPGR